MNIDEEKNWGKGFFFKKRNLITYLCAEKV